MRGYNIPIRNECMHVLIEYLRVIWHYQALGYRPHWLGLSCTGSRLALSEYCRRPYTCMERLYCAVHVLEILAPDIFLCDDSTKCVLSLDISHAISIFCPTSLVKIIKIVSFSYILHHSNSENNENWWEIPKSLYVDGMKVSFYLVFFAAARAWTISPIGYYYMDTCYLLSNHGCHIGLDPKRQRKIQLL